MLILFDLFQIYISIYLLSHRRFSKDILTVFRHQIFSIFLALFCKFLEFDFQLILNQDFHF